ncbi:hypothetical protein AALP_AA1G055800 [Arabis alpina]|uniref:Uncharacterized protein n=1 Tax=Arabis alpina TaxID=50452 RepID=A0A087HLC0_ARAAL|nr:hypothetical protein AALP_AA1G055800 [Arabis alpina]
MESQILKISIYKTSRGVKKKTNLSLLSETNNKKANAKSKFIREKVIDELRSHVTRENTTLTIIPATLTPRDEDGGEIWISIATVMATRRRRVEFNGTVRSSDGGEIDWRYVVMEAQSLVKYTDSGD